MQYININQLDKEAVKCNQEKCGFIYTNKGKKYINEKAMFDWFRRFGKSFYNDDFHYRDGVIYGWNGKWWVMASEYIETYTFQKLASCFDITVSTEAITEIVKVCERSACFEKRSSIQNRINYDRFVTVTFKNGTLELDFINNTHTFHENKFFKEHYALYRVGHEFKDELLKNDYWKNGFVGKYLLGFYDENDLETLQKYLAAILIPEYELQQGLVIWGEGGDGKGVLMGALKKLFGLVVTELKVTDWDGKYDTMVLVGSILNITSEVPSREISLDTWKSIVSNDWMTINPKYKTPFSYKPMCKHIMTVNSLPNIQVDMAVLRRMPIICTSKTTNSEDRSVFFRRDFEDDMDGLVSFILQGLFKLSQTKFKSLIGTIKLKEELIYQNETTIYDFIGECLDLTENKNDFVVSKIAYELFLFWKEDYGKNSRNLTLSSFSRKLINVVRASGKTIKSDSRKQKIENTVVSMRGYVGIKIKTEWLEKLNKHKQKQILWEKSWN